MTRPLEGNCSGNVLAQSWLAAGAGRGTAGHSGAFLASFTQCSRAQSPVAGQWGRLCQGPFCVVLGSAKMLLPVADSPGVLGSDLWVLRYLRTSLWASWFDVVWLVV